MRGWSWGGAWLAVCIVVAIIAGNSGDLAGWWIFLVIAGVGGYVALNIWQRQTEEREAQMRKDAGESE